MSCHVGAGEVESMGIVLLRSSFIRGLDTDEQSSMNYKWVLLDITLNCLQSFNLFRGIYITFTSFPRNWFKLNPL